MGFAFTLFYLFTTFVTPAEVMPALLPYRIMLVLLLVTLLASVFTMVGNRFSFKEPQLPLILALVIHSAITVLWADRWFGSALDATLDLFFLAGISVMVGWNIISVSRLRVLAFLLAATGIVITTQAIIALETGYRAQEFVLAENDDDHAGGLVQTNRIRGLGVLADPNDLAQFLLVDVALLGCLWKPKRGGANFLRVILPASGLLTGVYLTHSRGAILGFLVLLLLLLQKKMGKFGFVIGAVFGAVGIVGMTYLTGRGVSMQESSAAGRLDAWYAGMQMFKGSPLFGVGFNRFTEHNPLTAHNSYMLCVAELGFPGLLLWLGLIVSSVLQVRGFSLAKGDTPEITELRQVSRSVFVALLMFVVTAWFLSRTYATILFVLIGCAIALNEIAGRANLPKDAKPGISWKLLTACSSVGVLIVIYILLRIRGFG